MLTLSDYDYTLPDHLIAQKLADPADRCRLLVYNQQPSHHIFHELPNLLLANTQIRLNTSKVIKARVYIPEFDGELFFLYAHDEYEFDALVRPGKKMKIGTTVTVDTFVFTVLLNTENGRRIRCSHPILEVLEKIGHMPLPPYISYDQDKTDAYQPIQAKDEHIWSVAAPTASLHFTDQVLTDLRSKKCDFHETVLHIWLWTFKSVDVEKIEDYDIHAERIVINIQDFTSIYRAKTEWKDILWVGTTVTRTLETLPYIWVLIREDIKEKIEQDIYIYRERMTWDLSQELAQKYVSDIYIGDSWSITANCTLYIYPWFIFRVINKLITNFHLPKSSLLMLVAAFVWYNEMKEIYDVALAQEYKFFSFGDAMLLSLHSNKEITS